MKMDYSQVIRDYGVAIAVSVLVALMIRFLVIEAYRIPSTAMKPTLEPGDTIFVAKWPFGLRFPGSKEPWTSGRAPVRGEVVVFAFPDDAKRDYIKRVIALEGETVEIKEGRLRVNGQALARKTSPNEVCGQEKLLEHSYSVCWEPPLLEDWGPRKVPANSAFVIGDYRSDVSVDTRRYRVYGMVPYTSIKAKALWVWLSVEPASRGTPSGLFSRIRFERMFKGIE